MGRKKGTILAAVGLAATLLLTAMPATVATAPEGDVEVVTLALPPFALVDMPLVVSILVYNGEDEDITITSIYVCMEDDDDVLVTSKAISTSADWWEADLEEGEARLYATSFVIPETYDTEDVGGDSYDIYANVTYHIGTDTTNATTEESSEQMIWVGDPINDFLTNIDLMLPLLGGDSDDNDFFFFGSSSKERSSTAATGASPKGELQLLIPEVYPSTTTNEAHTEPSMNWDNVMY